MSKGPSRVGTQTVTTNNTPWNSEQLSDLYSRGGAALGTSPITNYNDPSLTDAFNRMIWQGNGLEATFSPVVNGAWGNTLLGSTGIQNSPAFPGLASIAANAPAAVAPYQKPLLDTAQGAYLNANPHLDGMFNAASGAVTRAYQTATAPQTDSAFEAAGRYGSGAMTNARSQNEQNLGSTLGNLASNIYGTNFANERALMNSAALSGGNLGLGATGAQLGALDKMQSGYEAGGRNQLAALGLSPSIMQTNMLPLQSVLQGAQGLSQIGRDAEMAPWDTLRQYAGLLGNPVAGSQTQSQPIWGPNPMTTALGGISAIGSLFNPFASAGRLSKL